MSFSELIRLVASCSGGPYSVFAGHDASRGLATMAMTVKDELDDLSDLTQAQLDSLTNWETQFTGILC